MTARSRRQGGDLFGDLAGILALAANKNGPLEQSDPSKDKVVAGTRNRLNLLFNAPGL